MLAERRGLFWLIERFTHCKAGLRCPSFLTAFPCSAATSLRFCVSVRQTALLLICHRFGLKAPVASNQRGTLIDQGFRRTLHPSPIFIIVNKCVGRFRLRVFEMGGCNEGKHGERIYLVLCRHLLAKYWMSVVNKSKQSQIQDVNKTPPKSIILVKCVYLITLSLEEHRCIAQCPCGVLMM